MRRKVFLNGRFLTQAITGVQRTAYELVIALDKLIANDKSIAENFEFILIYPGQMKNTIHLQNIKLLHKGLLRGHFWEQLELPLYTWGKLLVSMCMISPILKKKQIVIVHDASFIANPQFFSFAFRTWYKTAIRVIGKRARHIITVSTFSKNELIKYLKLDPLKISVIYNAADHMNCYPDTDENFKKKIEPLKPYCLAVSSLSANKNFKSLAEAVQKFKIRNYNMVIAGGMNANLQISIPDASVTYLGYVTDPQLKYLYSNASLFVFPSFYEGFGIPPLEAMISGCPVAASCSSSLPEVLEDACTYFDPYNVTDIANKISFLLSNKEVLSSLKIRGYKQADKYNWGKSALALYQTIARHV